MAHITLKGKPVETIGSLPPVNTPAPSFTLTKTDLSDVTLRDFAGKTVVLTMFPSVDTPVCALSVKRFNEEASTIANTVVLCISADLPFAFERFCAAEDIKNVFTLSVFRAPDFGKNYGVTITSGPLTGLLSRAIVIIDTKGMVQYTEQVSDIAHEPDYEAAMRVLKGYHG